MRINESNVVHLDHLIKRQSIRFYNKEERKAGIHDSKHSGDPSIRYNDITNQWFSNIRKPDFQRETNAWTPEQCCDFIESVYLGRIIPSIILWQNEENGLVYVLDGAHRLSIIRAWMVDDYGDKNIDYYERRDIDTIKKVAHETRGLINAKIGSFSEFKESYNELQNIIDEEKAPKTEMTDRKFKQATFYSKVISSNAMLFAQWEKGDYESAEQSFLRINRQGQPLNPAESTLIEYRRGSYSRVIMHIANAGEEGYYWPKDIDTPELESLVGSFNKKAKSIYDKLFVPSFSLPIKDLSVPILVAPAYFQKHNYLMELIPLLQWGIIADDQSQQIDFLSKDYKSSPDEIIKNADDILANIDGKLSHINSYNNDPKSLSVVPLFYWYNERGQFIRALFYSWIYWLFQGSAEDLFQRKIIYTSNRKNIEDIFFNYKKEISAYAATSGAGLKAVRQLALFYEKLLTFFHEKRGKEIQPDDVEITVLNLLGQKRLSKNLIRQGRNNTNRDKTQTNINELFNSSIKCHICGGVVDLKFGGIQYDHLVQYKTKNETDPENLKPTHPFCNNNRIKIEDYKNGEIVIDKPNLKIMNDKVSVEIKSNKQLSLFDIDFPN